MNRTSRSASRLPAVLAEFHRRYPDVRLELTTGTNDALVNAVTERRLDAAFIAEPPSSRTLSHLPVFRERLMVISSQPIEMAAVTTSWSIRLRT